MDGKEINRGLSLIAPTILLDIMGIYHFYYVFSGLQGQINHADLRRADDIIVPGGAIFGSGTVGTPPQKYHANH
jgi:hypothetical protein